MLLFPRTQLVQAGVTNAVARHLATCEVVVCRLTALVTECCHAPTAMVPIPLTELESLHTF